MQDILTASPTPFGRWAWRMFSHWSMRLFFESVSPIDVPVLVQGQSTLMIANHVSWWDGFWANEMNNRYFKREYHVMMLEEQLKTRMFLRKGGAYSIDPGKRSIIHSLAYTSQLLSDPHNLVLIFPQGKIHSGYDSDIHFMKGLDRAFRGVEEPIQVLFAVALTDFRSSARPQLSYYFQHHADQHHVQTQALEDAYRTFYQNCLKRQISITT